MPPLVPASTQLDASRSSVRAPADGVVEVGVAAVDDDVARGQPRQQLLDGLVHRRAGRHHEPDNAREAQLFDEIAEGIDAHGALVDHSLDRFGAAIVADDPMTAAHQPFGHVGAHAAQPDHA